MNLNNNSNYIIINYIIIIKLYSFSYLSYSLSIFKNYELCQNKKKNRLFKETLFRSSQVESSQIKGKKNRITNK
jgi:biopolymer transport protein ExbB/TolQ